ncbi:MAG: hypothetical protein JSR48_02710 [Verrucomicrobia bacterium]|nr:hypothetical protein [Verrucomicrobiota bacterium]
MHAGPPSNPASPPSEYLQLGGPSQEEGRRVLEVFRRAGIPGEYYLEFDLRIMPRRGEERDVPGRLWGGRHGDGAVTRVAFSLPSGGERRLLLQNGEDARVWCRDTADASPVTRMVDAFEPLMPGVELSAFDLLMPYLYWTDWKLERLARVRSRPTHVFLFRPPAAWAAQHPETRGVRAYLDTQFNVPVQTELIGDQGQVLRTLSLVDLVKVSDQYIPKSVDFRNDVTRDKVRFQVTAASLNYPLPAAVFDPEQLSLAAPIPLRPTPVIP